jgi:hypothetical protein
MLEIWRNLAADLPARYQLVREDADGAEDGIPMA